MIKPNAIAMIFQVLGLLTLGNPGVCSSDLTSGPKTMYRSIYDCLF